MITEQDDYGFEPQNPYDNFEDIFDGGGIDSFYDDYYDGRYDDDDFYDDDIHDGYGDFESIGLEM